MGKPKSTRADYEKCVDDGLSLTELSRALGVSKSTACERCKKYGLIPVKKRRRSLIVSTAGSGNHNALGQLRQINSITLEILQKAMKALEEESQSGGKITNPIALVFKAMSQVESQIKTEFSILEGLHEMEAQQDFREFSEEVLSVIEEVDPDVKREIIKRLHERKAARSTFGRA
jgi:hypothetical protein